jgi:hypothetical protein
MHKTIFIVAVLAVATILAAGLTVLPASVQEAQANPCSNNIIDEGGGGGGNTINVNEEQECTLIGNIDFDEDGTLDSEEVVAIETDGAEADGAEATETDGAEATAGNNIIDDPLFD